jgi:hypothetical protein
MCYGCNGAHIAATQSAYNDTEDNTNPKPFTDNNGAESNSGSINEQDLPNGGNKAKGNDNANIDKIGFGR